MSERRVKSGEMLALSRGCLHQDRRGFFWMMGSAPLKNERNGDVMIVHVRGELEHHKEDYSPAESYEGILEKFRWAYEGQTDGDSDEDDAGGPPKAIIMCVDSPGGVVSGLNECVAELQRMRREHPEIKVTCYVNEMATSAAYALACSCDEIVCPESAIIGSIGVISTMISQAARDKKEGFDVRLLTSGARKADGHLHAPITDEALSVEMTRVDKLAASFFKLASKARGLTIKKIQSLQAGIFLGKDAIREGLADRLSAYTDLLAGAQADKPTPAVAGGNQTDRRLKGASMNLATLIKKTKAAIATETDPKKLVALSNALSTYSASLDAYKKTEKHIEHTKTEEGDEDEDEEDEEDEEESEEKGAEDEKKASAKKARYDEKKSEDEAKGAEDEEEAKSSAKADDDGDDDDDEDEEKSAKKALALVQSLTGKKGAAGRGELRAMAMLAAKAELRLDALEKKSKRDEKASLIASVTGKYFTKHEAKDLAAMPLSEVRSLVAFAKKRGPMVHTEEGMLLKSKVAEPGTEESLPDFTRQMIDQAVAAAPAAQREKLREALVKDHLKAHNEQIATALNGAGRY